MAKTKLDILLVEDSSFDKTFIMNELRNSRFDYELVHAESLEVATKVCRKNSPFDLVLLDLNLPDSLGTNTLRDMLQISGHVPVIVMSGDERSSSVHEATDLGAQDYVVKSHDAGKALRKAIAFAISRQKTARELEHNVEILAQAATMDPLTGVFNLHALDSQIDRAWERFAGANQDCTCIYTEIDFFEDIQRDYGEEPANDVLRSTAVTLASKARSSDLVARIDAYRFCVLLPGTSLRDGWRLAERLRLGVEADRVRSGDYLISTTASIGVATTTSTMLCPEDLLAEADRAVELAKEQSRNVVVTTEELPPLESVLSK